MHASLTEIPPIPAVTQLTSRWFTEHFSAHESHSHQIRKVLIQTRTKFQKAILADSYSFGRCLILDGEMQSAQRDEFIYHECLVQPAMALHPRPLDVLVLGGGEGATVREILRHPGVKRVTMVDIDADVVQFCKRYLKEWHQGALSHPKTRVIIEDAGEFVLNTQESFDVIISDLPTPIKNGPVYALYTIEFYRALLGRLRPRGIFVTQAGSGSPAQIGFHSVLFNTLRKVFRVVRPCYAFVPSFDVPWAFLLCTQRTDPLNLSARTIDRRLGTIGRDLRFYDGRMHEGLFRIPKFMRQVLAKEKRIHRERKRIKK